jgi:hypothetical protein
MPNHYLTNDLTSRYYLSIRLFNRTWLLILLLTEKQEVLVKAKVDNNKIIIVAVTTPWYNSKHGKYWKGQENEHGLPLAASCCYITVL